MLSLICFEAPGICPPEADGTDHVLGLKPKIIQSMYILNRIKRQAPIKHLKLLYICLIHSDLEYGVAIWANIHHRFLNKIALIEKTAMRIVH